MGSKSLCSLDCMSLISGLHTHAIPSPATMGLERELSPVPGSSWVDGWWCGAETNMQAMVLRTTLVWCLNRSEVSVPGMGGDKEGHPELPELAVEQLG